MAQVRHAEGPKMIDWGYVDRWAKERLSQAREKNDGFLDEVQTQRLRGRIEMLKELIALPAVKERATRSEEDAPD